jgi:ABC-2 type transport system ATP-binding protein
MPYCIETSNLTKQYPIIKDYRDLVLHPFRKKKITALCNLNLQVKKGELFGLLGPNGAGKTTLIKILCTLVLPTSGRALINGYDVMTDDKKIRKVIGFVVSEERSFYWRLTGRQNLKFFATLNNITGHEAEPRIQEILELMGLQGDADRMFKDYSTGMRQKLAIARGLLADPEILFLDEPTRSLDPVASENLRKFIKETIIKKKKKTVIFSTHNLQAAQEFCDRIAIIHKGEIKTCGTLGEIRRIFDSSRRYVLGLKNTDDGLLDKICNFTQVRAVVPISNGSLSNHVQVEVEIEDGDERIPEVIEGIVGMGGKLMSCYQKEIPLADLFAKITNGEG